MSAISIWQFFTSHVVGVAVVGLLAYLLVAVTDLRRRGRRKKLIRLRVEMLGDIAQQKLEATLINVAMIRANQFTAAPVTRFPLGDLRDLQRECLDTLSADQINALDALIYWFEAIDGFFDETNSVVERLKGLAIEDAPTPERDELVENVLRRFEQARRDLTTLLILVDWYINDNPQAILEYENFRADRRGE